MNRDRKFKIEIRVSLGASATDISNHIKSGLRKEPKQIILHADKNDDTNFIKNVKKILKMIRETFKVRTSFSFNSKVDFTENGIMEKSELNPKILHIQGLIIIRFHKK